MERILVFHYWRTVQSILMRKSNASGTGARLSEKLFFESWIKEMECEAGKYD